MSYSNGLLQYFSNTGGRDGTDGKDGVGFDLTSDGNYDMNGKKLTNAADPAHDQDLVTKKYMETHVGDSHITTAHKKDVFDYVMKNHKVAMTADLDSTIGDLTELISSPFIYNKKVISIVVDKDAINNFSSGVFIKISDLSNGDYTMAFDLI